MKFKRKTRKKILAEINITPFTDVVLVLLVVFIIATPMIVQDNIKIHLPEAKKSENAPKNVTILITEKQEVYIDNIKYGITTDLEKLKNGLAALIKEKNYPSFTINGDRNCRYEVIISVIDILNQLGIKRIHLGVELIR